MQFCGHRRCKNEKSAERAEIIFESYCKFLTHTCNFKKSQQPDGKNKSFQYLKSMIHDPLLSAKLKFFDMVSGKLNEFLRGFQTNKSMVPFIADTLGDLIRNFFGRIIVKDILKKKSNLYNLIQIDPLDNNIRKNQEKKNAVRICSKTEVGANKIQFEFCKDFGLQETSWRIFSEAISPLSRTVITQICSCT